MSSSAYIQKLNRERRKEAKISREEREKERAFVAGLQAELDAAKAWRKSQPIIVSVEHDFVSGMEKKLRKRL